MGWYRALIGKGATADAGADWGVVEWGDWHVGLRMMIWLVVYELPQANDCLPGFLGIASRGGWINAPDST
jgi:hypothetical protein